MKKKNTLTIITIIIALVIVITGGIAAFLTDTDQKTNVFTVGLVKINVTEDNWNPDNGQNVLPGQPINKDPKIDNIGKNPAYVYIKVEQPINSDTTLFSYTTNSGWTLLGDNSETDCPIRSSVYYYNTALESNASTNTLFDSVTVNDYDENMTEESVEMVITGYAIQSSYLPSGTTISSAYNTYFKNRGISDCSSYSIYRWDGYNLKNGDDISSLSLGTDYVTDKSQVTNMSSYASKYYLKHDISYTEVAKSYVCFVITPSMETQYPGTIAGEHCLEGGDAGAAFESNKDTLALVLGNTYCNPAHMCNISGMEINTFANGQVTVFGNNARCTIPTNGKSTCYSGNYE